MKRFLFLEINLLTFLLIILDLVHYDSTQDKEDLVDEEVLETKEWSTIFTGTKVGVSLVPETRNTSSVTEWNYNKKIELYTCHFLFDKQGGRMGNTH